MLEWLRCILKLLLNRDLLLVNEFVLLWCDDLANNDVVTLDFGAGSDQTVAIQLVVGSELESLSVLHLGSSDLLGQLLTVVVGSEEDRPEKSSVDSALVHHDGVFLIIA